ncbi:Crp/Fnr family transcriptional regulator, partial [Nonomuraea sp. LPB2021202275-12-8]|uniref:Crp/Fnr family transcriptional regulator n=1 Tax=Nonomuraea sp. LPB2021202275-12-8 TaxID=3120159 RepID=UPI00300C5C05
MLTGLLASIAISVILRVKHSNSGRWRLPVAAKWPMGTFLARLPEAMPAELIELGTTLMAPDGTRLIRQGDPGALVYLILQGLVKITTWAENGEQALLAVRVSGDVIGEMAILGAGRRSADATTCGQTSLTVIKGNTFIGYLQRHPNAALALSGL